MAEIWCEHCNGMGTVECLCGGDQCICDNCGEKDCALCNGQGRRFGQRTDDDFWCPQNGEECYGCEACAP